MDDNENELGANAPLIPQHDGTIRNHSLQVNRRSSGNIFVWTLTLSAGISGLLFGYDTGVISSTLVSIGTDLSSRNLTDIDKGLITASTSFFALLASPAAGLLADRVGRKNVVLFSDALFTLGALWQASTKSVWGMILGRSIVGLAIGAASLITPLYISELAPGHLRGRLVTVSLLFITGGQVVAYIVGWLFSTVPTGWRYMVGLGAAPSLIQLLLLVFMPETPRQLARAGKEDQARVVLQKVYQGVAEDTVSAADEILTAIKGEIRAEQEAKTTLGLTKTCWLPTKLSSLLFYPPHARALSIACLLQGLQQLCGFNSLMYYSATLFDNLKFSSPTLTALSIAVTNFSFTIVAFYLIDRTGRRRILLITLPIMVLALILCAIAFTFVPNKIPVSSQRLKPTEEETSRGPAIAILATLILYVSSYATGMGNVPWQQSELFPLGVRSLGSSIATATNWGSNTVVGLTFLPLMQAITPGWTFVLYSIVCAVGFVMVWLVYPETAGLDLEEVSTLLQHGWGVKESTSNARKVHITEAVRVVS